MKKVSLGIILNGDPNFKQNQTLFLKILRIICRCLAIVLFIATMVLFVIYMLGLFEVIEFDADNVFWIMGLFFASIITFPLRHLWSEKVRCPYCNHFFTMKRISGNSLVDREDIAVSRKVDYYSSGVAYDLDGNIAFVNSKSSHTEHGTETTETYTYNMRCKCCGCVNKVETRKTYKKY